MSIEDHVEIKLDTLNAISAHEHKLVEAAPEKYGAYWENAEKSVMAIQTFSVKYEREALVSMFLLVAMNQYASLALLSAARKHAAQSALCFRFMLEAAVLSAYSLFDDQMSQLSKPGTAQSIVEKFMNLKESKNIRKKAHAWIEESFPTHSSRIEELKTKYINKIYAHVNIPNVISAVRSAEKISGSLFFDAEDSYAIKRSMWAITDGILCSIDLVSASFAKSSKGKLDPRALSRLYKIQQVHLKLKTELKKGR
ncbi:MAG: hypothetical protein ABIH36_00215 [bacterium]